ncbi:MAG: phosphate signaling complex protein PhoU [Planctomycetota bacterium]
MRDALDDQLAGLLTCLLKMGGLAERMIGNARDALLDRDEGKRATVFAAEEDMDRLQSCVDHEAVLTIIKQQPVASDVRLTFALSRAASNLERVGDCTVNICQAVPFIFEQDVRPPAEMRDLFDLVKQAVTDALEALISRDVALAQRVVASDETINERRDGIFRELLRQIMADPSTASSSMSLVLVSRNLERIGDHATNIAEDVIYMVRGDDVRHAGEQNDAC